MTDRNANRPGYKKTPVGWIPNKWECVTFGSIVGKLESGTSLEGEERARQTGEKAVLKVSAVSQGRFIPEECKVLSALSINRMRLVFPRQGEIMISRANTPDLAGDCAYIDRDWPDLLLPDKLWQTTVAKRKNYLSTKWLSFMLQSHLVRIKVQSKATGTSMSMKNISQTSYLGITIPFPPLPEQGRIAEILATWDEALGQTRQLLAAARDRKRALMQHLLTNQRRLKGHQGSWRDVTLGKVLAEVSRPVAFNDDHIYDLISVRRRSEGIFRREPIRGKDILTKDLYLAKTGDFLISKMQVLHGASALVTPEFDETHISGSYIALRVSNPAVICEEFLDWLSRTPQFYHLTYLSSYGVHIEKMTFCLDWFLEAKVRLPSTIAEQRAIAEVLVTADAEVRLLDDKLAALDEQKRGLMQKLLTGEVRVVTK